MQASVVQIYADGEITPHAKGSAGGDERAGWARQDAQGVCGGPKRNRRVEWRPLWAGHVINARVGRCFPSGEAGSDEQGFSTQHPAVLKQEYILVDTTSSGTTPSCQNQLHGYRDTAPPRWGRSGADNRVPCYIPQLRKEGVKIYASSQTNTLEDMSRDPASVLWSHYFLP